MENKFTEGEVALCIAEGLGRHPFGLMLIQNSLRITRYEADLLLISSRGFLDEIEIKVSVADFNSEFKNPPETKKRKHRMLEKGIYTPVHRYFIAFPAEIYDKIDKELIPPYAGIIIVYNTSRRRALVVQKPKMFTKAEPLNQKQLFKIIQTTSDRYWRLKSGKSSGRK